MVLSLRPYSICRTWIQIHSESAFGFTGKSNGLDSWVLSEVTSYVFVYVCDTDVTSGFASEFTAKLDSPDSRIRIRIRQIEYGLKMHDYYIRVKKYTGLVDTC